jgi:hypothetical protein
VLNRAGGVAQALKCLPHKCEALSCNLKYHQKINKYLFHCAEIDIEENRHFMVEKHTLLI